MSTTDTEARDYTRAQDVNQFLTFTLKGEEFGIEILRVQEIKGYSTVTPIPNAPPHIKGVMNLRGTVVPVVDLRSRFAMAETEADQFTVIIVVRVGKRVVGLVVDAVSDVLNIGAGDVEAPPEMGQDVDISFLTGVAKSGERLTLLLDIEKVVGNDADAVQA